MAPDRIEKIEAIDPGAGRLLRLTINYVEKLQASRVYLFTGQGVKDQNRAKRDAADLLKAMEAALSGEEIEQGGLPFE
jgi:hypothetical protein